ncbi:hypothetical protein SprV_0200916300 [Sparganum proliferum]
MSRSMDLLFDTGDKETKCPWTEMPYTCIEVECSSLGITSEESHHTPLKRGEEVSGAQVDEIYDRLSRIETALHMTEEASVPPKSRPSNPLKSPTKSMVSPQHSQSSKSQKLANSIQKGENSSPNVISPKASTARTPVVVRPPGRSSSIVVNSVGTKVPSDSFNESSRASPKPVPAVQKSTPVSQTKPTSSSSSGPPKTPSKARSVAHPPSAAATQTPKKNDASAAGRPSTSADIATLPPKGKQTASTPSSYLEHLRMIIDSVVAGLDDYSASLYTTNDYVIEPPRASVTEVTVREFGEFEAAMKREKSRRSSKRPSPPVDVDEDGDASPADLFSQSQEVSGESMRRKKKSKTRRSSNFGEEFSSVADETIVEEDSSIIPKVHKKHGKHRHNHHE